MKRIASAIGIVPLALIISGSFLFHSCGGFFDALGQLGASTTSTSFNSTTTAKFDFTCSGSSGPSGQQYVQTAFQAAQYYAQQDQLPSPIAQSFPTFFVRQIYQESRFCMQTQANKAGAIGIAQFLPSTASGHKAFNPATGQVVTVDPLNPVIALYGSAKMMADNFMSYLHQEDKAHGDQIMAYVDALVAYNAGGGNVSSGTNWGTQLSHETRYYVYDILEPALSAEGQQFIHTFTGINQCDRCY